MIDFIFVVLGLGELVDDFFPPVKAELLWYEPLALRLVTLDVLSPDGLVLGAGLLETAFTELALVGTIGNAAMLRT